MSLSNMIADSKKLTIELGLDALRPDLYLQKNWNGIINEFNTLRLYAKKRFNIELTILPYDGYPTPASGGRMQQLKSNEFNQAIQTFNSNNIPMAFALNGEFPYKLLQESNESGNLSLLFDKNRATQDGLISSNEFNSAKDIMNNHGIPSNIDFSSNLFQKSLNKYNHTMPLKGGILLEVEEVKKMLDFTELTKTLILLIKSGIDNNITNTVILFDIRMNSIIREIEEYFRGKLEHIGSTIRYARSIPLVSPVKDLSSVRDSLVGKNKQEIIEHDLKIFDQIVIDNPSNLDNNLLNSLVELKKIIFFWNLRCAKSNGLCERHYFNLEKLSRMDPIEIETQQFYQLIYKLIPEKNPKQCTSNSAALVNNLSQAKYLIERGVNTFKIARSNVATKGNQTKEDIYKLLQLFCLKN